MQNSGSSTLITGLFCRYREIEVNHVLLANVLNVKDLPLTLVGVVSNVVHHNLYARPDMTERAKLSVGDRIVQVSEIALGKYYNSARVRKIITRMHRRGTYMVLQKQPSGVFYSVDLKESFQHSETEYFMEVDITVNRTDARMKIVRLAISQYSAKLSANVTETM